MSKLDRVVEEDKQARDQFYEGWDKDLKTLEGKISERFDAEALVTHYNYRG